MIFPTDFLYASGQIIYFQKKIKENSYIFNSWLLKCMIFSVLTPDLNGDKLRIIKQGL